MKFFIYLITIIVIIALAGLFVFKQPNGQAWLSIEDFLLNTQAINEKVNLVTNQLHEVFKSNIPEKNTTVKVYRWKDSNGNWSYSDKSKAPNESTELLFDQNNIVVLPAFDTTTTNSSNPIKNHGNTASKDLITKPNKVVELYKDVNNVQGLMDTRQDTIAEAIKKNTN